VIHGLAPLRTYQFRVRAQNIHGSSEPSCPSDPLFFQPPLGMEKRDKAAAVAVVDQREKEKSNNHHHHMVMAGQGDDYDQDDEDESHSPQFEHCHVAVQPGEPHFLVGFYHFFFKFKLN
jgi:hypothetical protein